MQDTRLTEESSELESKETEFESFRSAQKKFESEVQHGKTGHARLVDCELVDASEIPSEYKNKYGGLSDKYLVFDAVLGTSEREVTVVCPARDGGVNVEMIKKWTNSSEIDDFAGQRIPVRHVGNDVYRVEIFKSGTGDSANLDSVPVPAIKWMVDKNLVNFNGGTWESKSVVPFMVSCGILLPFILIFTLTPMLGGTLGAVAFFGGTALYLGAVMTYKRD